MYPSYRWGALALCACLGASCRAADPPLPAPQVQGSSSYVSGGIGQDEAAAFRAASQQYNLRLIFSSQTGEYYAGVKVTLRDAQGKTVIETTSDGPFVFFNVLPGKYQITAENLGHAVTRSAQVRAKRGTELYIRWNTAREELTQ